MWIPRNPAHSSLFTVKPEWHCIDNNTKKVLCDLLGKKGELYKLGCSDEDIAGHYKFLSDESFFLKVLPDTHGTQLQEILKLEEWLYQNEAPVLPSVNNLKLHAGNNYTVTVYPYLEARFVTCSKADIKLIGTELSRLHKVLKSYPLADNIKDQNDKKINTLRKVLTEVKRKKHRDIPGSVQEVLTSAPDDFLDLLCIGNRQILHGDLNIGNILITENNSLVFVDYENSLHTYSSVLIDIAFLLERVVLNRCQDTVTESISYFLEGYRANSDLWFESVSGLADILQALSVRSMLLLTRKASQNGIVSEREWEKFVDLYTNADKIRLNSDLFTGAFA